MAVIRVVREWFPARGLALEAALVAGATIESEGHAALGLAESLKVPLVSKNAELRSTRVPRLALLSRWRCAHCGHYFSTFPGNGSDLVTRATAKDAARTETPATARSAPSRERSRGPRPENVCTVLAATKAP
ncbi:hypothetical protein BH24ACT2_BH24ACT2_17990 [soil metagenome]